MRILIDTSILVEVDRNNNEVIELMKKITLQYEVFISVITVSEILTGAYLRKDHDKAIKKAKLIMGQMSWIDVDPLIAEKASEINAYLIINGKMIDFQDVLIAATSIILKCNHIVTMNKRHFERVPALEDKVLTPLELKETI